MKKILIPIIITLVVIAGIIFFIQKDTEMGEGDKMMATTSVDMSAPAADANEPNMTVSVVPAAPSLSVSAEVDPSSDGIYWGFIKKSTLKKGELVLTVDFIEAFENNKDRFVASIQDDVCKYNFPGSTYKNKQEFLNKALSLNDVDVDALISTTSCFPNGIAYFRNSNPETREITATDSVIAYPAYDGPWNTSNSVTDRSAINALLNSPEKNRSEWNILIRGGKIMTLTQMFRP